MRSWAMATALVLPLASPVVPEAVAGRPSFDWTVTAQPPTAPDATGLARYAVSPRAAVHERFLLTLRVTKPACDARRRYAWRLGRRTIARGRGRCSVTAALRRERRYPVTLRVAGEGATRRVVPVQDWLIVGIGDSVGSGEGNPDIPRAAGRAVWRDRRCHRSALSGMALAPQLLEQATPRTSVTFVHLACSGATVTTGLLRPYSGVEERGKPPITAQLDVVRRVASRRKIDALVVSIGANDIYFAPVVIRCLLVEDCPDRPFDPRKVPFAATGKPSLERTVHKALRRLRRRYERLAAELRGQRIGRVFLLQYFDPTSDATGGTCRHFRTSPRKHRFDIDVDEARWAHTAMLRPLNDLLAREAKRHGWRLIGRVAMMFRTHGYCTGARRWVNTIPDSVLAHGGSPLRARAVGAVHPNGAGHAATAGRIARVLIGSLPDAPSVAVLGPIVRERHTGPSTWALVVGGLVILLLGFAGGFLLRGLL
jgi:lysophospholipase L1-like esterase